MWRFGISSIADTLMAEPQCSRAVRYDCAGWYVFDGSDQLMFEQQC